MKFVDPQFLFVCEPPVVPVHTRNRYYDLTEVGMSCYLQILPSVALYGIQYQVFVDESNRVLDGNFRVYAALELGLLVPVTVQKTMHYYNVWIVRILRRVRRLFKRNWLFFKKLLVDESSNQVGLVCLWQLNILIGPLELKDG